jgi:PilZ domain
VPMNQPRTPERRFDPRQVFRIKLRGRDVSSSRVSREPFHGEVQNISSGGLGLLTDHPVQESSLIHAEIVMPDFGIGVPSLMQVRWLQRLTTRPHYRVGLQFVL